MSVRPITAFVVECDLCDRVATDYDDAEQWFESRDQAIKLLDDGPEPDEGRWLILSDGRAFCDRHAASAPTVQTGPDLFEAVSS